MKKIITTLFYLFLTSTSFATVEFHTAYENNKTQIYIISDKAGELTNLATQYINIWHHQTQVPPIEIRPVAYNRHYQMNVTPLLPKFISKMINHVEQTYSWSNCWNTTLNTIKVIDQVRGTNIKEISFFMNKLNYSPKTRIMNEVKCSLMKPGDVIYWFHKFQFFPVHTSFYIGEGFTFTKNGSHRLWQYMIERLEITDNHYGSTETTMKCYRLKPNYLDTISELNRNRENHEIDKIIEDLENSIDFENHDPNVLYRFSEIKHTYNKLYRLFIKYNQNKSSVPVEEIQDLMCATAEIITNKDIEFFSKHLPFLEGLRLSLYSLSRSAMSVNMRPSPYCSICQGKKEYYCQKPFLLVPSWRRKDGKPKPLPQKTTRLMIAAENGETEEVLKLVEKGSDINAQNKLGNTSLILASQNGRTETVKNLLSLKANPNIKNKNGLNSLHAAIRLHPYFPNNTWSYKGLRTISELLVKDGIDVNATDIKGRTPLMYACMNENLELARFLIENGADVNARDSYGKNALYYTIRNKMLYRVLLEFGVED